jgi:hypothetical protein
MTTLRRLDLSGHSRVDLTPLEACPQLEALSLPKESGELRQLQETNITSLTLNGRYDGLREVHLHLDWLVLSTTKAEDLSPLSHLSSLKHLRVGKRRSQVNDLTPLTELTALESLSIPGAKIIDLTPLRGARSLRTLALYSNKNLSNIAPLSGLEALVELDLNLTAVADLSPLAGLARLESLKLRHTKVTSIEYILGLPALKSLYLEKSKLSSVDGIAALNRLERLWIWGTKVKDITPIEGMPALTDLNIADLGQLGGCEVVATLPALDVLDVYQTEFDPMFLAEKRNLRSVRGCDYPPPIQTLEEIPSRDICTELGPGRVLDGRLLSRRLPDAPHAIALSPDGSLVAASTLIEGAPISIYSTLDASATHSIAPKGNNRLTGLAFGSDGDTLYYLETTERTWDFQLVAYRLVDGSVDSRPLFEGTTPCHPRLVVHPSGKYAAVLGRDCTVLDLQTGTQIRQLDGHAEQYEAQAGCFAASTPHLYVAGPSAEALICVDISRGEKCGRWPVPCKQCQAITLSDDERYLSIMGGNCYGVFVFDLHTGQRLYSEQYVAGRHLPAVVVSRDGSLLVECQYDLIGRRLPEGPAEQRAATIPISGRYTYACVDTSVDGSMVAFACFNHRLSDHRIFWMPLVTAPVQVSDPR